MTRWPRSVRWRLTLWYTAALALVLSTFAAWSLVVVHQVLESRTDHFLEEARRAFLAVLATEEQEYPKSDEAIRAALDEIRFDDTRLLMLDANARIVGISNARGASSAILGQRFTEVQVEAAIAEATGQTSALPPSLADAPHAPAALTTIEVGEGLRMAFGPVLLHGRTHIVAAVRTRRELKETMERVTRAYLIAIPLGLLVAVAGGYTLARRALAPIVAMSAHARAISASTLHERLPIANPHDELGGLAGIVNALLSRLENAFSQQRQFVADASHELRTPVAVLRAESEVTLSRSGRSEEEYRASLRIVRDASQRLSRIVDDLFMLARADSGQMHVRRESLYLDELVDDSVRAMQAVAAARDIELQTDRRIDAAIGASMIGDPDLIQRILFNLLDNAIKYSHPGSVVRISLADAGSEWVLTVADNGPGIPLEMQSHIFERFVRADPVRASQYRSSAAPDRSKSSGAGLGLAIARRIAEYHGGVLSLTRSDANGSEFKATLPKSPPTTKPSVASADFAEPTNQPFTT